MRLYTNNSISYAS